MTARQVRVVLGDGPRSPWADGSIPVPPPATVYPWERGRTTAPRLRADPTTEARAAVSGPLADGARDEAIPKGAGDEGPPNGVGDDGSRPGGPSDGWRENVGSATEVPVGERRGPWVVLAALAAVMALAGTAIVAADDRAPGGDTGRGADVTLPATDGAGVTPPATDGADDAAPGIARGGVDERPPPSVAVPALRTQLSVAALAVDGSLVVVDPDRGSSRRLGGRRVDTTRPAYVVPSLDEVSVVAHEGPAGYRVPLDSDGGPPEPGPPIEGPLYPGPAPGSVWRRAAAGGAVDHVLVDGRGAALGPRIGLPFGEVLGGDGRGGLLVRTVERVIVAADSGSVELVTNGSLVAAGGGAFWVRECAVDGCVVVRVDRRTGDRTAIELGDDAGVRAAGLVGVSRGPVGPMGQTVSPDGDVALVRRSPVSTDWLMVDLDVGRATEVPPPAPGAPVAWTADSRYAAWLSAGTMRVFDRTVGGYTDVPGTGPLHTFAVLDRATGVAGSPSRMEELADEAHGVPAEAHAPGDRSPSPATRAVATRAVARRRCRVTEAGRRARSAAPSGPAGPRGPSSTGS